MMKRLLAALLLCVPLAANAASTITHISDGTTAFANATSLTVTIPGTPAANDLILLHTGSNASPTISSAANADGSLLEIATAAAARQKVYCQISDGSTGSITVTPSASATMYGTVHVFRGTHLTCATILAQAITTDSATTQGTMPYAGINPVTDNSLVLIFGRKNGTTWASVDTPATFTECDDESTTTGGDIAENCNYVIQGTKANIAGGNFTITTDGVSSVSGSITMSLKEAVAHFTAAPAAGTITSTTIPTTFTSDATGNVKAVACADGTTGSAAETLALTCAGGAAAAASFTEAVVADVGDGQTFTGLAPGTRYDLAFIIDPTAGTDSALATLGNQDTLCGTPTITDIDTDESVTATQTNVVLTGTGFCTSGTVTLRQSGNSKTLSQDSYSATSIQVDMSGAGMGVASGLIYGSADFRVTNSATFDDQTVTIAVPSGSQFDTLSGGLISLEFDGDGNPSRIYGDPIDVGASSQVGSRNAAGCTTGISDVTIDVDGTYDVEDDCTSFDVDFTSASGSGGSELYIGTMATQTWKGDPPAMGGIDIDDHVLAVGVAMTSYDLDNYFVAGAGAASARALRQLSAPTDSGTDVNGAVTSAITMLVDDASVLVSKRDAWIRCGTGTPVQLLYADPLTNYIGLYTPITCADNAQIDNYTNGAKSISQITVNSGSGVVSGTPDTDATTTLLTYRWTDAASLFAETRIPFQIDVVTIPSVLGDALADGTAELEALGLGVTSSGSCTAGDLHEILTQTNDSDLWNTNVILEYVSGCEVGSGLVVYEIASGAGLSRWVDYLPVSVVPGCVTGTYDEDGCLAVAPLSSTTGKVAWVDYVPVLAVAQTANKWRYENDGWVPVNTLTP